MSFKILLGIGCIMAACLAQCATNSVASADCAATGVCTLPAATAPRVAGDRMMWATSRLYCDTPALEVAKWLGETPDTQGKFILIEFWRTWCGACKRMTPLMNALHEKHGAELVVIGITGETEEAVKAYTGPEKKYHLALDRPLPGTSGGPRGTAQTKTPADATEPDVVVGRGGDIRPDQGACEAFYGVWGWPHVVILEPEHNVVIWEGFPGQPGYELTEEKIVKMLSIGRKSKTTKEK